MYKILIIGHGEFPSGIKSSLNKIVGQNENVFDISIDLKGHDFFEKKVKQFLSKNTKTLIFADLTGGAPHQIVAKEVFKNKDKYKDIIVVSGAPLSFLVQYIIENHHDEKRAKIRAKEILKESNDSAKIIIV